MKILKRIMSIKSFIVLLLFLISEMSLFSLEPNPQVLKSLRRDHPRIFFNAETFPAVRARALNEEKAQFLLLKQNVDDMSDNPSFSLLQDRVVKTSEGKYKIKAPLFMLKQVVTTLGGEEARVAAFVYLVTKEKKYLEKAKKYLFLSIQNYDFALKNQICVEWNHRSYEGSICAYDWLYSELTPEERKSIATTLLHVVKEIQEDGSVKYFRNCGGSNTGYYGSERLLFYTGTAFYGDGIDDDEAERQCLRGIKGFNGMLEYREKISQGTGALGNLCVSYAFGDYPETALYYFFAVQSAYGVNEAAKWTQMRDYPKFTMLNWLPGPKFPLEFGLGDVAHYDNGLPLWSLYETMRCISHLYPESAPLAMEICRLLPPARQAYRKNSLIGFFLTGLNERERIALPKQEKFMYVPSIGVAYFRSGNSQDDTFAAFRAGGISTNHVHYDQNHFVIYKNGFLALDSGTRAENQTFHTPYYYAQSIAHNTILIDMPYEPIAHHWGPQLLGKKMKKPFMDGGQNRKSPPVKTSSGKSNDYAWILNDATQAYSSAKCRLAEREFLHLYPDLFLVIDRVESTNPDYKKRWLLHSQNEPVFSKNTYEIQEGDGVLLGQIIYPESFVINKIGGSGKEFFASGKNWALDPVLEKKYMGKLHGNWRIEISPEKPQNKTLFINLLQAGKKGAKNELLNLERNITGNFIELKFVYSGKYWKIHVSRKPGIPSKVICNPVTQK